MIGNDIVAFNSVSDSFKTRKYRFLNKLFSGTEQLIINKSIAPEKIMWTLWSMKESAYKVHRFYGGQRLFNPKAFQCIIRDEFGTSSELTGKVSVESATYNTKSQFNDDFIHTTAAISLHGVTASFCDLGENSFQIQSNSLKSLLLNRLSSELNLPMEGLKLMKDSFEIPRIFFNNELLKINCSLSHHGFYGAYAYTNERC